MKKAILWLLVLGLAFGAIPGFAAELPYEVVVPLEYAPIRSLWGERFLVSQEDSYALYSFDGERTEHALLEVASDAYFAHGYLVIRDKQGETCAYTLDFKPVLPRKYQELAFTDETHCVVMDGREYRKPGIWVGELWEYDLAAGTATSLGEQSWGVGEAAYLLEADQRYSLDLTFTRTAIYNPDGQRIADFAPYLPEETVYDLPVYDQLSELAYRTVADERLFLTGRGRLITRAHVNSHGLGDYLCVYSDTQDSVYVMDRDGGVVIPPGVFESYAANEVTSNGTRQLSDDDRLAVVSKDGKYGVIRFLPARREPSAWAAEDIDRALALGLVPTEAQKWWKDSCTRLEFCQMLGNAVRVMTGQTLAELAEGLEPAAFSDCGDPDVQAAAALGIVNGMGGGRFAPERFLTRAQAALILTRTAGALGVELVPDVPALAFDGPLSPDSYCTVEQAAVTVLHFMAIDN
jgi:hypothetical protein